jgi:hypothetical protein
MKVLLVLSLILNGILGFLFYQEKSRPPLERIVVEEKTVIEKVPAAPATQLKTAAPKTQIKKSDNSAGGDDFQPLIPGDEHGMQLAVEDMEVSKKDFFLKNDIPEKILKRKEQIMQELFERTMPIYQKHPTGITLSFEERRKLIDLEEEAQTKVRALFGEKNWNEYKKFVDQHNKKIIEGTKSGEYTGVLMGY